MLYLKKTLVTLVIIDSVLKIDKKLFPQAY